MFPNLSLPAQVCACWNGYYQKAVDDLSQAITWEQKISSFSTANAGKLAAAITGMKELANYDTTTMLAPSPEDKQNMAEMLHFRAIALDKVRNQELAGKDRAAEKELGGYKAHDPRERM